MSALRIPAKTASGLIGIRGRMRMEWPGRLLICGTGVTPSVSATCAVQGPAVRTRSLHGMVVGVGPLALVTSRDVGLDSELR